MDKYSEKGVCLRRTRDDIYILYTYYTTRKTKIVLEKRYNNKYMNRNAITALLFLFGSLIFTLDSIFYIIENAQNHHGYLYCVGSIAFSIGSYISYTTTTQQK